ncbi:amidohydrolase [Bradyrhizobium sp. AUGA SZCCT0042]|uniref:amidohydrolase family protein n=1 Tax=Bradyrhizobium sp. AUGA SZCCT0042 TaxID=2807651 RepID=UPI001BAAC96F|nr:amidohydrolase family protein [Bradyrhizobium sp. AUGA SZCCT0042]MBR1300412.1 amidohydrolase family protein [Bradyrhizobium sp. AUGA SZCCT0042]
MPSYLPFDPNPRRPLRLPPPKSIDSQFHVLGPVEKYPIRAGAAYQMPSATWEAALRVHKALGIERGIIVQTTTYGADHSVVLDGLAAMGSNYRVCANALVFAEADDSYLARLDAAGVGGARFSFRKELGAVLSDKDFERAIARIRELGWYAKFQPEKDGIVGNLDKIRGLNVPVLIDHMGRPDPLRGKDDPNLRAVLDLLSKGNFWVMLSLGEKTSKAGPPWDDVIPIARAYIEAAPDRCVWASDWPHPVSVVQPPNDADLLELLYRYAPDEAELEKILVTNPARLFGFPD